MTWDKAAWEAAFARHLARIKAIPSPEGCVKEYTLVAQDAYRAASKECGEPPPGKFISAREMEANLVQRILYPA